MNTTTRISTAERLGRSFGRGWRGYLRREQRVARCLVTLGVPAGGAAAVLWIVKLAVLGVLLYSAFWLALLLIFAVIAAGVMGDAELDDEPQTEWRTGPLGFGLYHPDGSRIDPHDPDAEA